jgi:hypothetical protein
MSALALLGFRNAKSKSSPLWPQFDEAERKTLNQVLESRVWGHTPGPESNSRRPLRVFMGRHGIAVTKRHRRISAAASNSSPIAIFWNWRLYDRSWSSELATRLRARKPDSSSPT